jgi:hypothetical protein
VSFGFLSKASLILPRKTERMMHPPQARLARRPPDPGLYCPCTPKAKVPYPDDWKDLTHTRTEVSVGTIVFG